MPAPAALVLNRPDPSEKSQSSRPQSAQDNNNSSNNVRLYRRQSQNTIDLAPQPQQYYDQHSAHAHQQQQPAVDPFNSPRSSVKQDPFEDTQSIQTASTGSQATNVIPIAFVDAHNHAPVSRHEGGGAAHGNDANAPHRPVRSPELNLDHTNVSSRGGSSTNGSAPGGYAHSMASGISGMTYGGGDDGRSYISNASYSSDFLNEAPVIVTPTQGSIRQVLGVHKAEVMQAPASPRDAPAQQQQGGRLRPKQSIRSPLAASSFGPADVLVEADAEDSNGGPSPIGRSLSPSNTATFTEVSRRDSNASSSLDTPTLPWTSRAVGDRPASVSTQGGSSIIGENFAADIGTASRVNLGLSHATTAMSTSSYGLGGSPNGPRSPYRQTMARYVQSPGSSAPPSDEGHPSSSNNLEQQQALAHAHAQAQAQGTGTGGTTLHRRASGASMATNATGGGDSILESFHFVPPSPISNRPPRSPPVSPNPNRSTFGIATPPDTPGQELLTPGRVMDGYRHSAAAPESATLPYSAGADAQSASRKFLGMSGGTRSSALSGADGLGGFPFQVQVPSSPAEHLASSRESGRVVIRPSDSIVGGRMPHPLARESAGAGSEGTGGSGSRTQSGASGVAPQRASLDTLALTSALTSYPLRFESEGRR